MRSWVFFSLVLLIGLGAGCAPAPIAQAPAVVAPQPAPAPAPTPAAEPQPVPSVDPYEGWGTIEPGGVVSLRIPPGCHGDPGAGNIYVVCPTPGNDTPTPDMHVSSDGMQVNIRRWEDMAWEHWDKVVASLRVLAPLGRDVQINIQK